MRQAAAAVLATASLVATAWAQDFAYKWTDANGAVHISASAGDVPPELRGKVEKIKVVRVSSADAGAGPVAASGGGVTFPPGRDRIVVTAVFNDKVSRAAIIDTGSEWVTISPKLARALGADLETAGKALVKAHGGRVIAPVVDIESVSVGGAKVTGLQAAVLDAGRNGPEAAVIGMSFLSLFNVEIDPLAGRMSLESKDP